jgi:ABC-type multidrug transport system permease subunit
VTYPIAVLPQALQWVSQTLPPTQTILLLRDGVLTGGDLQSIGLRVAYLLAIAVVLIALSTVTLRRALSRARRTGRLAHF